MKIVEISASLGNDLKRYNVFEQVSMKRQPFTERETILYGVTKGTDIVQTNAPTNILIDIDSNPIDNSEPVYFGIRVYPFISMTQQISCNNNTISYGEVIELSDKQYFPKTSQYGGGALLPDPYTGELYPQPEFVPSLVDDYRYTYNHKQAMQQFVNDCTFPTKPNLDLPGQRLSGDIQSFNRIGYFTSHVCVLSELNQRNPEGILNCIVDEDNPNITSEYERYMVRFDGQNLNFKFGMAVNSDFGEPPKIYLPYLYRTYCAFYRGYFQMDLGLIMQCLLYDSNGNVITG